MTPNDDTQNDDTQPLAELEPLEPSTAAAAEASPDDGRWVWQYGAPPPPPSFGAQLFSAGAPPEFLRFAFCALLVILGALLPWGPELVGEGADAVATVPPSVGGVNTPLGAVSLMLGVWLLYNALAGAYTRGARFNVWPALFMVEPLIVSVMKLSAAMDAAGDAGFVRALEIAGSGILFTLVGSGFVVVLFALLIGKIVTTKDDKGSARRSAKGGAKAAGGKSSGGKSKGGKDAKPGKAKKGAGADKKGASAKTGDASVAKKDGGAADAAKS